MVRKLSFSFIFAILFSGSMYGMEWITAGFNALAVKVMQSPSITAAAISTLGIPWLYCRYIEYEQQITADDLFLKLRINPIEATTIIEQGIENLEIRNDDYDTPLLVASKIGLTWAKAKNRTVTHQYVTLISTLLHVGADINARDAKGKKAHKFIEELISCIRGKEMNLGYEIEDSFLMRATVNLINELK